MGLSALKPGPPVSFLVGLELKGFLGHRTLSAHTRKVPGTLGGHPTGQPGVAC